MGAYSNSQIASCSYVFAPSATMTCTSANDHRSLTSMPFGPGIKLSWEGGELFNSRSCSAVDFCHFHKNFVG
jgi:hypothetical protein